MRLLTFLFLLVTTFLSAQSNYKRIAESKIDAERLKVSRNFIESFLMKCEGKDYTSFKDFNLSSRMQLFYQNKYEKSCEKSQQLYGKIEILGFNANYLNKYSENKDPLELFVYDVKTEKIPEIKYVSVWIYRDKNYINGIWISKEKPLHNNSMKSK